MLIELRRAPRGESPAWVRRPDLLGFLDAATRWAHDLAPGLAVNLVAKLDGSFAITGQ
ncbi:hypothetical protein H4696_000302 [Amycolatopsis lexingtonensis]|uniref:Uncharacterized protein n=1 Tax=Amycolatopsis lexingtonensis TaxID=218822 RepID=A0ABR9HQK5_9PSEU|nr:hypothetical protein [Amycolatopsis lexingtonensis]MBE1493202.1 hypothetical protein [Amycolatopsis lexingtonensis]